MNIARRNILATGAAFTALGSAFGAGQVLAQSSDSVTIAWPSDVPNWDPNQRFVPDSQSIFKAVFDQPLSQDPALKLIPHLIAKWELAADATSLAFEMRDDVLFHDGSKMTTEDFRWSLFDRIKVTPGLDIANSWRKIQDIEIISPTRGVMKFNSPAPTAPQWLSFLGSYVVPKKAMEAMGVAAFAQKPVGSGPYRMVEWEQNSRIVLERNDAYWGPKPAIKRVTIQVVKDASARVAAIQSGQVDITFGLPIRDAVRLQSDAAYSASLQPITRVILLQIRDDLAFADENVRLAAHHAIDKQALSRAFFNGAAVPLSVPATPGSPGHLADYQFAFDAERAKALLAKSGFSAEKPVKLGLATTNGQFPGDFDIARAIAQMWKKVGIEADVQVIEYAKYFELNRGGKLPEATLYTWDNATADPEIFTGYLLNPKMPFSAWKGMAIGQKDMDLFNVANYDARIAGYRALNREAAEAGATMPLLQSVITVASKKALSFAPYGNGWVLPQTMKWTS
jgi:peptide/nickel transport system substrate-binding protein